MIVLFLFFFLDGSRGRMNVQSNNYSARGATRRTRGRNLRPYGRF